MKEIHLGEKNFICLYCGEAFSQNTSLQKHIQSRHSEVHAMEQYQNRKSDLFYGWEPTAQKESKLQKLIEEKERSIAALLLELMNQKKSRPKKEIPVKWIFKEEVEIGSDCIHNQLTKDLTAYITS